MKITNLMILTNFVNKCEINFFLVKGIRGSIYVVFNPIFDIISVIKC